jgi:hypothetical protein
MFKISKFIRKTCIVVPIKYFDNDLNVYLEYSKFKHSINFEKVYIATDKNGRIYLHWIKPSKNSTCWISDPTRMFIGQIQFEGSWEDSLQLINIERK